VEFWNGTSYSFLFDHPSNNPGWLPAIYISDSRFGLDYMKLAFLKGCKTSYGGTGSLAWWWRCAKGTDCVVGFQDTIYLSQSNEYMEQFFKYMIQGYGYDNSDIWAMNAVTQQFGSYYAGNVYSRQLWGHTAWSASTPGWGVYEGLQ
jgi:hypothetical protein